MPSLSRFLALSAGLMATSRLLAQASPIKLGASAHISTDAPRSPHAESFFAINPRDPANRIATSLAIEGGRDMSVVYVTRDGGRSWQRGRGATPRDTVIFAGGDPIVYFDRAGTAYFGTIQGTPIGFLLSRSTDGGLTWQTPVTIPGGTYDRQYLAFDTTGGRFDGRMYAGGTISVGHLDGKRHNAIVIVYSTDGGRTWSAGKVIGPSEDGEGIFVIADLAVTSDGTLVIPYSTYATASQPRPDSSRLGHLGTFVSEDGGTSFKPAIQGPIRSRGPGFRSSQSDAAPRFTIDASNGPHRGRWYFNWMDFANGKYSVKVAYSDDRGKSWSSALVVNDGAGDPANPAIAVNRDGIVAVSWNDRRDDPKNACYRLYVSASTDGGEHFLPNVAASTTPTCPSAAQNWVVSANSFLDMPLDLTKERRRPAIALLAVPVRWPNGGDTQGLSAARDGSFTAGWLNAPDGVMQLWSTTFTVDPRAVPPTTPVRADLSTQLQIELTSTTVDFATHTVSLRARLKNPTPLPIAGPFTVVLDDLASDLPGIRASNADNGLGAKGAAWQFRALSLGAGATSDEKTLTWTFTGGIPERPTQPFRAHFLILGK